MIQYRYSMKKIVSLILFTIIFKSLPAQEKNISSLHFDISGGISLFGASFSLEPKFEIKQIISLGLKGELAYFGLVHNEQIKYNYDPILKTYAFGENPYLISFPSIVLTGDHYFGENNHKKTAPRYFLGLGTGLYFLKSSKPDFGLLTRAGFEKNHFRFALEYNFIHNEFYSYGLNNGGYLNIKFGVLLGRK